MSGFWDSLGRLSSSALDNMSNSLKKKSAESKLRAEELETLRQQNYKNTLYTTFKCDYDDFAGKLKSCLESNHKWYGLFCPKDIRDIYCQRKIDMIDGELLPDGRYQKIVFRFEVKREATNTNIHTISAGTVKYVPVKETERLLQADLLKYIDEFSYTGLTVSEIADEKVKITISGVDRPQTQQAPSWGMMIW